MTIKQQVLELGRSLRVTKMPINFKNAGTQTDMDIGVQYYGNAGDTDNNIQRWYERGSGITRGNNTWYQNTTGRPIQLGIGMHTSKDLRMKDQNNANNIVVAGTGGDPSESGNLPICPVGHYYCTTGYRTWSEFR